MAGDVLHNIREHGHFTVGLLPGDQRYYKDSRRFDVHETVLRPLLAAATECWVYELTTDSPAYQAAAARLSRSRGKWSVDLQGDPIRGHEVFWNANSGKRGTIVIVVPAVAFEPKAIFPHCKGAWHFVNPGAGNSRAALRFARERSSDGKSLCLLLSRNNGIEWMDVYTGREAVRLYKLADGLAGKR